MQCDDRNDVSECYNKNFKCKYEILEKYFFTHFLFISVCDFRKSYYLYCISLFTLHFFQILNPYNLI